MVRFSFRSLSWLGLCLALTGFSISQSTAKKNPRSIAEAKAFIDEAEARLSGSFRRASRANWVQSTHITEDTEILWRKARPSAPSRRESISKHATRFDRLNPARRHGTEDEVIEAFADLAAPSIRSKKSSLGWWPRGRNLWQGKYCRKDREKCPDVGGSHASSGPQSGSQAIAGLLGGMASHCATDAKRLQALRGAGQQGRA